MHFAICLAYSGAIYVLLALRYTRRSQLQLSNSPDDGHPLLHFSAAASILLFGLRRDSLFRKTGLSAFAPFE